jgi:hypothetical protein
MMPIAGLQNRAIKDPSKTSSEEPFKIISARILLKIITARILSNKMVARPTREDPDLLQDLHKGSRPTETMH